MAEGDRLNTLCRLGTLPDLYQSIFPASELTRVDDFQRLCLATLAREVSGLLRYVSGPGARLLHWFLTGFQLENLKILIRTHLGRTAETDLQGYLTALPERMILNVRELSADSSLDDLMSLMPHRFLRREVERAAMIHGDRCRPFFLEAALDHAYLKELLASVEGLPREDREMVLPMARQTVDMFHLALVVRGRFLFDLAPEVLLPLHVMGGRIRLGLMTQALHERDLPSAVERVAPVVLGGASSESRVPASDSEAGWYERAALKEFLRFSNLAFRRSHVGLAAVVGYIGIRQMEVTNLITISEGIRLGMTAEAIRGRMVVYSHEDGVYV